MMKKKNLAHLPLLLILWLCSLNIAFSQDLKGIWFDSESNGFYEFQDTLTKDFYYEAPNGERSRGVYESQGTDQEGAKMFRATLKMQNTNEERNLFIKIYADGRSGYVQYKCMKKPFFKAKES